MLDLLSNLPYVLTFWTSVVFCWGLYVSALLYRGLKSNTSTSCYAFTFIITIVADLVLLLYLIFEPELAKSMGDAIIVIDVFYTAFLTSMCLSNTTSRDRTKLTP
jgi:hypothetical protein